VGAGWVVAVQVGGGRQWGAAPWEWEVVPLGVDPWGGVPWAWEGGIPPDIRVQGGVPCSTEGGLEGGPEGGGFRTLRTVQGHR